MERGLNKIGKPKLNTHKSYWNWNIKVLNIYLDLLNKNYLQVNWKYEYEPFFATWDTEHSNCPQIGQNMDRTRLSRTWLPGKTDHVLGCRWSVFPGCWCFFCDICLLGSQLLNQGVWILIKQQVWGSKDGRSPDIWSVIIGQKVTSSNHSWQI